MQTQDEMTPATKLAAGYLLTDRDLVPLLSVGLQTLRNWRWHGTGPHYIKVGSRAVRYKPEDVRQFLEGGQAQVPSR